MGTLYIGLDVHKVAIAVSIAEEGREGAVRFLGEIPNTPTDVAKLAKRLAKDGSRLEFCYEAGGCGYVIYRQLTDLGHGCMVVAPSLIPKKPGDRDRQEGGRRPEGPLMAAIPAGPAPAFAVRPVAGVQEGMCAAKHFRVSGAARSGSARNR